jgi:hypothetical protein
MGEKSKLQNSFEKLPISIYTYKSSKLKMCKSTQNSSKPNSEKGSKLKHTQFKKQKNKTKFMEN